MKLSAIAASVALLALGTSSAMAADGTITIDGAITTTTCVIESGSSGTPDATVKLPTVSNASLAASGDTAGEVNFFFNLSGPSCAGTAKMHFESASSPVNLVTGRLTNEAATNPATNVEVAILNADGSKIDLATSSNSQAVPIVAAPGKTRLDYFARYEATGAATAGPVETHVDYTMSYN
ncbi:fimbrial protein [Stenotrophomonas sp. SAU14A_NAIMI4_8]|uniref:fimbrial protein n=1 Tax=Stenotrophomonas sp. SAU14A_NAIMI4_8 TaxID=2072409 RepID=UPI000D54292E|nr:fimbrial protein [Stenotrophomonas sp. SAU14A_NAIMI4_8]AWH33923.1 type 1 fimbrial protein [Stenotrophomonas sp. SAU14A_NAIMI4_8]